MQNLFHPLHIVALAGLYALVMMGLTCFVRGYGRDKAGFLVAGRTVGIFESGLSIAATWIWAPALFVGAQEAYTDGWVGVFWFTVPNILCLVIFAWFAAIIRDRLPEGYTFSAFVRERFSARCHSVYLFQFTALAICSYAVQILAGAGVIKILTGMPFVWCSILLSLISLSYTLLAGLKISIVSDVVKMMLIFLVGIPLVALAVHNAGGWETIGKGMGGLSGDTTSLVSSAGIHVFLKFGLPTTIGLLAGPFGDQSFWQRAFSAKKATVKKSFLLGAFLFGIVPLTLSLLGFAAAGAGLPVPSVQNTNVYAIFSFVGPTGVLLFLVILIAGLVGTLDSRLASVASLAGHDVLQRWFPAKKDDDAEAVRHGRLAMIALVVVSVAIANIPGVQILHLFLLYGQIRAATFLPTVMAILGVRLKEGGVFWGIVTSFLVGLPIFAWGNFNKEWPFIVGGSLLTVLASAAIAVIYSRIALRKEAA
jgi:Na+/proline symporter